MAARKKVLLLRCCSSAFGEGGTQSCRTPQPIMQPQSRMISLIFHPGIAHLQPMTKKRMEQEIGNQVHREKKVCTMQVCGSPEIGQRADRLDEVIGEVLECPDQCCE